MTQAELEKRQERAVRETLIIKKTDDGYRVYSPGNPARNYLVSRELDDPRCSCPDFENHANDHDWRCKHILAVAHHLGGSRQTSEEEDPVEREERLAIQEESRRSEASRTNGNGTSQMLLKRSVSPDGRIDSLSVEFSCPTSNTPVQEVKRHARRVLELQSEIVGEFLGKRGNGNGEDKHLRNGDNGPVQARMLGIGGMDTKWGRRLYINVQVNGDVLKYFGSRKALAEAIEAAGYPNRAERLDEGTKLDLPCRVTTKQTDDGRYVNIDEVLPAASTDSERRSAR
jgi:predicted nucleic acid-binding Zn finger protein